MEQLTVYESLSALEELADRWEALCLASSASTPFQRACWILPWIRHFAPPRLHVLALSCGADLVALAPLFSWGPPERRTVSLLGAGVSDHLDVLAVPGFEDRMREALREWLDGGGWRSCSFDEIGSSAVLRQLRPPPGVEVVVSPQSVCPVLTLPPEATCLEQAIPKRQTAQLRKCRNRASRVGRLQVERAVEQRDVGPILRALFDLHARRWAERAEADLLGDPRLHALKLEAARAMASDGTLRMYALQVEGRPAAVVCGFRWRARLYLYAQGIDPAFERVSPGTLLVGALIDDARKEGIDQIDFLRGDERYKYHWGAVDEPNVRIDLRRPGL